MPGLCFASSFGKKEVYELLSREQKEKQRAFSPIKTCVKLMMGIILLAVAYGIGCGILSSELGIKRMFRMTAILCFCGVLGTFFFFQGLAYLFDRICRKLPGEKALDIYMPSAAGSGIFKIIFVGNFFPSDSVCDHMLFLWSRDEWATGTTGYGRD